MIVFVVALFCALARAGPPLPETHPPPQTTIADAELQVTAITPQGKIIQLPIRGGVSYDLERWTLRVALAPVEQLEFDGLILEMRDSLLTVPQVIKWEGELVQLNLMVKVRLAKTIRQIHSNCPPEALNIRPSGETDFIYLFDSLTCQSTANGGLKVTWKISDDASFPADLDLPYLIEKSERQLVFAYPSSTEEEVPWISEHAVLVKHRILEKQSSIQYRYQSPRPKRSFKLSLGAFGERGHYEESNKKLLRTQWSLGVELNLKYAVWPQIVDLTNRSTASLTPFYASESTSSLKKAIPSYRSYENDFLMQWKLPRQLLKHYFSVGIGYTVRGIVTFPRTYGITYLGGPLGKAMVRKSTRDARAYEVSFLYSWLGAVNGNYFVNQLYGVHGAFQLNSPQAIKKTMLWLEYSNLYYEATGFLKKNSAIIQELRLGVNFEF